MCARTADEFAGGRDSRFSLDRTPPQPTPGDRPIEAAQSYVRAAILNDRDVIRHLLDLRPLRDEHGRYGWPYLRALHNPVLLEQFTADYLDHRVAVIRERLDSGFWGLAIPVGQMGAGYGRDRGAYPSMDPDTIERAVADFVRRLTGREHPALAVDRVLPSTVRQYRRRLRQLVSA